MFTVGIDLGTTASVIAFVQQGKPRSILVDSGKKTTPSVVNYGENNPIVGREAIFKVDSGNTVFSVKRFMGSNEKFCTRTPEEISADILTFLKKSAEYQLRNTIDAAVITVPAHFSEIQRIATKRAASIAGIKVLQLINEPTAAAFAFGLDKQIDGIYAVYDLGGGTFDFSILRLKNGVFQVLATGGDNYLGGDDLDNAIAAYNFKRYGLDISEMTDSEKMLGKLIAKSMKEKLETNKEVYKNYIYKNKSYEFYLSKDVMEQISVAYLNKTFEIADQVLTDSRIDRAYLDGIVLVGGMTKMQLIKEAVKKHFNVNIFTDLNPEEVVAFGAAIQAEAIAKKESAMLLIDVTPLTLGIETIGGGVDKIIHRNTPIPIMQKREYTTYQNNQTGIKFHIVQGERSLAKDCKSIAEFELTGIPKMPSGTPRITVEFSIDMNGLLSIKAYEKNTGITQLITVEPSSGLTEEEMTVILENAATNKEQDSIEASYITIKVESERQIKFWRSILEDIPRNERKYIKKEITKLENSLAAKSYQDVLEHKKNIENLMGKFLDEIISSRLSKKPMNISQFKE